jgi:hypothetical protein
MRALRTTAKAAAALTAVAALTCTTASIASASSYIGTGIGTGTTSALAEDNAISDLYGSYEHCQPPIQLVYDHQEGGTLWYAEVKGECSGIIN